MKLRSKQFIIIKDNLENIIILMSSSELGMKNCFDKNNYRSSTTWEAK